MIPETINKTNARNQDPTPIEIKNFKDDDLSQKGKTKHIVETDWPVKETVKTPVKKKKINRTETARLP